VTPRTLLRFLFGSWLVLTGIAVPLAGAQAGAQAEQPAPELLEGAQGGGLTTVTPNSALRDGDLVTVEGADWPAGRRLAFSICGSALSPCIGIGEQAVVDGQGEFEQADVWIRAAFVLGPQVEVDCRTESCSLVVYDIATEVATAAPLDFDPSASLLPAPALVVAPASEVRDGQVLHLTGERFLPWHVLVPVLCLPDPQTVDDCDAAGAFSNDFQATSHGDIDTEIAAVAAFQTGNGAQVDCRATACEIALFNLLWGNQLRGGPPVAAAGVSFDPSGDLLGEPLITAHPTSQLPEEVSIEVRGRGFRPLSTIEVVVCPVDNFAGDGRSLVHCDFNRREILISSRDGEIETTLRVRRSYVGISGVSVPERIVDCSTERCALGARDPRGGSAAVIPLDFLATDRPADDGGPIIANPSFTG
jgi:hypothetical protein